MDVQPQAWYSGNRGLCLINQRRVRLIASVLVNGGHF